MPDFMKNISAPRETLPREQFQLDCCQFGIIFKLKFEKKTGALKFYPRRNLSSSHNLNFLTNASQNLSISISKSLIIPPQPQKIIYNEH